MLGKHVSQLKKLLKIVIIQVVVAMDQLMMVTLE
jgi:hypothetical protein